MSKNKTPLNPKQVETLTRVRSELMGVYLSSESFADSNVKLPLQTMLANLNSLLAYADPNPQAQAKRKAA